jgi:integral membrane protein
MATMTGALGVRGVAGWFRVIALAEAVSWVGLLIGMHFKYLGSPRTEVGVKLFGPVHGAIFVAFVVVALLAGIAFQWGLGTWLLALLGSIVPLGSVIFLIWADRSGRMGAVSTAVGTVPGAGQPGRSVSETT